MIISLSSFGFECAYAAEVFKVLLKVAEDRFYAGIRELSAEIKKEHDVKASVAYGTALDPEKVHIVYEEFGQQTVQTTFGMRYGQHYGNRVGVVRYLKITGNDYELGAVYGAVGNIPGEYLQSQLFGTVHRAYGRNGLFASQHLFRSSSWLCLFFISRTASDMRRTASFQ